MTTTHPKRRFFRYSLRTLMVVVTVFCIWMGITAKRARDQKQAVEMIQEMGGIVIYEYEDTFWDELFSSLPPNSLPPPHVGPDLPGPAWLCNLVGIDYLDSVHAVVLGGSDITDSHLKRLRGFPRFVGLDLFNTSITDEGLEHLKGFPKLQELSLSEGVITDAGLVHLKGLTNLWELDLGNTQVTDAGLVHLKGLTNLRTLELTDTQITDAGLMHLKGLTKLKELWLYRTQVTGDGVKKLQQALPNCRNIER